MTKNWWQKLIDWFSDEPVEEHGNSGASNGVKGHAGRIEENRRNVLPRVVHHYPQNDQSRPALNFNRPERKPRTEQTRLKKNDLQKTEPPVRPQKEKFTGVDFKAEDIPSPVFGFHKRRRLEHHNIYFKESGDMYFENEQVGSEQVSNVMPEENHSYRYEDEMIQSDKTEQSDEIIEDTDNNIEDDIDNKIGEDAVNSITEKEQAEAPLEKDRSEKVPPERNEKSAPEDKPRQTTNKQSSPAVPYNVMMLQRDKRKKRDFSKRSQGNYKFPSLSLLAVPQGSPGDDESWLEEQQYRLEETLRHFNVKAKVAGVTKGPSVTRFEIQPSPGVKVNKITKLNDDLKLNLAAKDIRIEAPIPGKNLIGIEIPNRVSNPVFIREIIRESSFQNNPSPLTAALGLDISGAPVVTDLQKMPHGLIAGATGSGKSVCINSLLVSLLYKALPEEVKFLLIDPKMVELAPFQDIPHLAAPVITDPKEASLALKWVVQEMERRYEAFADSGVRDIAKYNKKHSDSSGSVPMPYIVVVIDELADLMMVSPQDVEDAICRIAQKARACGIHLILATQRPSVDVITGLIKANVPTRIAFSVSSQADSRTIMDSGGAEKLLGKGDMLFIENGASKSVRVQGNFVSDDEIDALTEFVKRQGKPEFLFQKEELINKDDQSESDDGLFEEACYYVLEQGAASSSALQRRFRIGYNRAARLIDMMEVKGIVSEAKGSKPRGVLISKQEYEDNILNLENSSAPGAQET